MNPIILMRTSLAEQREERSAREYFDVITSRAELAHPTRKGPKLVIPRYSALPYYNELEADVALLGGELINMYAQHRYVADLKNWYADFEDLTPKTWFRVEDVPRDEIGPFVLKGATNSRKHLWKTHMFAKDRSDIARVMDRLLDDPLISEQGIYVRQFEEFETYGTGINGLPITDEWRYFILDGKVLARGFYWSDQVDPDSIGFRRAPILDGFERQPRDDSTLYYAREAFVRTQICPRLKDKIRFAVADVALNKQGRFRLVELNDGTMSGLSCVDPDDLYLELFLRV